MDSDSESDTATSPMAATCSVATTGIMLEIDEKKTLPVDLYYPVRYYVLVHYSETEFQNLEIDLQSLTNLRSVVENPKGSLTDRRDLLINYFKALCSAGSILPFSSHPNHINAALFTWFDAFKKNSYSSQPNLDLEKASFMFNLGAVYSQIGLSSDLSTTEGMGWAMDNFCRAAGAFAYLRDRLAPNASGDGSATVDLSIECARALERLMLAQALECLLSALGHSRSFVDRTTPAFCGEISRQVGVYYKEAFDGLNVVPLSQHFDKMWMTQIQLKAAIFSAESFFRHSLDLREKEKKGEEIATLKIGISALPDVKKFSTLRGRPLQLVAAVNKLKSDLSKNLQKAIQDNDSVYQQSVPCSSSLVSLPVESLLKRKPMDEILDACKEGTFARIFLDTSAEAFTEYTGTVEKMVGYLAKKLQVGSEQARVRLEKMRLPIVILEEFATLPEELRDEVEAIQISGGTAELEANLQQLIHSKRVNQELLAQTKEMLQNQVQEDGQCSAFTKNFWDRANEFAANLQQADREWDIKRSLKENSALMSILDLHPIEGVLPVPHLVKPFTSVDANETATVWALKQSLSQLDIVSAQRVGLEGMLKEIKTKDDILPKLIDKDFTKLEKINVEISENFAAENQILERIQEQNRKLSAMFKLEDLNGSKKKWKGQIEAALAKYKEIKEKIKGCLKIHTTLEEIISGLKRQCDDNVISRNSEGNKLMSSVLGQRRRQLNTDCFGDETSQSTFLEPAVNEYRKPVYPPGLRNSDENVQQPGSERRQQQQQQPHHSPPS